MRSTTITSSHYSIVLVTSFAVVGLGYYYHRRKVRQLQEKWDEIRKSERTGRIRAECRLRQLEKPQQKQQKQPEDKTDIYSQPETFLSTIIGTVTSPYTKRMGTPRQPQLVPSSRGYIQFTSPTAPSAALDGIAEYSHVWIIFVFHANTNTTASQRTKIRPPRAKGLKVGSLATRSPHRPNPIGLSLCQIAEWLPDKRQLQLRGLDLVHGTPVLDIKPYVPWVSVGPLPMSFTADRTFRVPDWVLQEDSIANVEFTATATQELNELVSCGKLSPLYTTDNDGVDGAVETLTQILAQDPRSSHRGLKTNSRGSTVDIAVTSTYSLIFGQTRVEFRVSAKGVEVVTVTAVDFDESAYVDGVPLMSEVGLNRR